MLIAYLFRRRTSQPAPKHLLPTESNGAIDRVENGAFDRLTLAIEQEFQLGNGGEVQIERVQQL